MAMSDAEFDALKQRCREERARGLAGHWTYDLPRHRAIYAQCLEENQRRDIAAIDAAFERASQRITEAAE